MPGLSSLCMNCMMETDGREVCSHCGFAAGSSQQPHALPFRTRLQNRYAVGVAKRSNGEGFVYIGYDTVLNLPVEIHEFFPQSLCERAADRRSVRVMGGSELAFDENLASFLNHSREVAHIRELAAIVQIYDIFEENHTAYAISEWEESITLRYFVERSGGQLDWNEARPLFMPVLSALSTMHSAGVSHLGISPETLRIVKDGKMKLGGFCIPAVRTADTDLPSDIVPGCAAIEQYVMGFQPEECTDVYGFAASLFFALTGTLPQDALKRRTDSRLLIPTSLIRSIPPHVITALANALQVSPDKRTPTFERLRAELSAAPTVTMTMETPTEALRDQEPQYPVDQFPQKDRRRGVPPFVWVLVSCVACLIVFTVIGVLWLSSDGGGSLTGGAAESSSALSSAASSQPASSTAAVSSMAENQIPVPNLVGQEYDVLASQAEQLDYQLATTQRQFSDTVPEGCIISQTPEAGDGQTMTRGTMIVVVVSQGPSVRELPDITNLPLAQASTAVSDAGFVPSKVEEYSDTVPAGCAIGYQNVKAGDQMSYGSPVVIVISRGPEPPSTAQVIVSSAPPASEPASAGFPVSDTDVGMP